MAKENTMFLNNIIVTMPDNISFFDKDKRQVSIVQVYVVLCKLWVVEKH